MKTFINWLSLFASSGTLLCCALPSLFVALGMGASLAGFVSAFPQLVWVSQYKLAVFAASGIMLAASFFLQRSSQNLSCPADPALAEACMSSRKWSQGILYFSILIWATGATFAFVLPLMNF